jgi:hypothetical protein
MSFQSLRASRDKKQTKSFVTDPAPSSTLSNNALDKPPPPLPEKPVFLYDLPASMEMEVVPEKGRAIFSTINIKPGFLPVHQEVLILVLILDSRHHTTPPPPSCAGVIDTEHIWTLFLLLRGTCNQTLLRLSDCLVLRSREYLQKPKISPPDLLYVFLPRASMLGVNPNCRGDTPLCVQLADRGICHRYAKSGIGPYTNSNANVWDV